ncbi:MAG TPA: D-alanyl-D-alanine carboxypeptidase/D-alanyl-D-alanine-endopeptidase, partial [Micromonospora sp.]
MPAGRSRRKAVLVTVLAVVLVLGLAVAGLVVVRPGPVAGWLGKGNDQVKPTPTAEPAPSPVLAAANASAPQPTPEGVRAAIEALVTGSGLGERVNVSVLDVASGDVLYDHGAEVPTVPASTTKLVTAVAVLAARGPAYRISTRAVAGEAPGEVVLVGGGDPTLAVGSTGSYPGAARLDKLAEQVKQALGGATPTKVTVDVSLFSGPVFEPGWDADIPTGGYGGEITALMTDGARVDPKQATGGAARITKPDLAAGRAFAKLLGLPPEAVSTVDRGTAPSAPASAQPSSSPGTGTVEPGAELGRVESPPMIRLVDFMLGESDNIVAECLARQVALAKGEPASFVGGATATLAVLNELGLPVGESKLADGSGLSRSNRLTPTLLTHVLALAGNGTRPEVTSLVEGLPVAAWSGTLNDRFGGQSTRPGAGVVRGKTGTLSGVHAISGVLTTADGRLLAFAVLADRVPLGPDQAQPKLDKIAATLVG